MSLYKNRTIKHHTYPAEPYARIVSPPERDEYSRMYKIHKYWARKPWYTISEYIKYFTREGEVVLGPFCGSGVTGIEAIINGREAFLIDLNPTATFIAEMAATVDVDFYELKRAFCRVAAECQEKIHKLYWLEETCSICNGPLETRHVLDQPFLHPLCKPIVLTVALKMERFGAS